MTQTPFAHAHGSDEPFDERRSFFLHPHDSQPSLERHALRTLMLAWICSAKSITKAWHTRCLSCCGRRRSRRQLVPKTPLVGFMYPAALPRLLSAEPVRPVLPVRDNSVSPRVWTVDYRPPTARCACAVQMLQRQPSAASRTTSDAAGVLRPEVATVDRLTRSCSGPAVLASHARQGRTPRSRLGRGARQGISRGRRGHRRDAPRPTLEGFLLLLQACQVVDTQPASTQRTSQPGPRTGR